MKACTDHATPADRLGTSNEAKRARAIGYLRSRGRYIFDANCTFVPTSVALTDIRVTMDEARERINPQRKAA